MPPKQSRDVAVLGRRIESHKFNSNTIDTTSVIVSSLFGMDKEYAWKGYS